MNTRDNFAAPSSAVGGAITVIRVSGPDALRIGNTVWHGRRKLAEQGCNTLGLKLMDIWGKAPGVTPGTTWWNCSATAERPPPPTPCGNC